MKAERIIVKARILATRQKVWDYYTQPQHIINWNFADPSWHCPSATNDLQIGGVYLARMEAKDGSFGFDFEATYTDIQNGKLLTYNFGGRQATVEFSEQGKATEVTIAFEPETENDIELQKTGWQAILNNFKNYTESL